MKKWNETLWLLTPDEYAALPDGTNVMCIDNEIAVKGTDYIDQDTRFGCIAYGFTKELVASQNLDHEFLMLLLQS